MSAAGEVIRSLLRVVLVVLFVYSAAVGIALLQNKEASLVYKDSCVGCCSEISSEPSIVDWGCPTTSSLSAEYEDLTDTDAMQMKIHDLEQRLEQLQSVSQMLEQKLQVSRTIQSELSMKLNLNASLLRSLLRESQWWSQLSMNSFESIDSPAEIMLVAFFNWCTFVFISPNSSRIAMLFMSILWFLVAAVLLTLDSWMFTILAATNGFLQFLKIIFI